MVLTPRKFVIKCDDFSHIQMLPPQGAQNSNNLDLDRMDEQYMHAKNRASNNNIFFCEMRQIKKLKVSRTWENLYNHFFAKTQILQYKDNGMNRLKFPVQRKNLKISKSPDRGNM